jgi:hypothetical protein
MTNARPMKPGAEAEHTLRQIEASHARARQQDEQASQESVDSDAPPRDTAPSERGRGLEEYEPRHRRGFFARLMILRAELDPDDG